MNENHKTEIDNLLSDLIDGEATERQETEFKRLVGHDSAIVEQLAAMRRQKQLLNELPIESAPASLADEIRSALERKLILGDVPEAKRSITGAGHLLLRRILTTAAMLLIPLGLLSFVVYEIMKPASGNSGGYVSVGGTPMGENHAGPAAKPPVFNVELPFNGTLTFSTDQQIAVSNYVQKRVFDQGMIQFTESPSRTADAMSHQIIAPPEKIVTLIDSLGGVWSRCQTVTLSVADRFGSNTIEILQVQPEQVTALAAENSREMLNNLANQYARANINKEKDTRFAAEEPSGVQDIGPDGYPKLRTPILTGIKVNKNTTMVNPSQPTVRLQILIKQTGE